MIYKPLVDKTMIKGSTHGQIERHVGTLTVGAQTLEQVGLAISDEYTKLVQEFPEYEFGIIADNLTSIIRVTWKLRE